MADKTISDLTQAESIGSEDLFVLEQGGEAKKLKGARLVKYAQDTVGAQVTVATEAAESAETAKTGAESAQTQAQAARDAILNMLVEAITLEQGSPATVERSIVGSVYKLTFGLPSGKKGDPGATGPANTLTIGTVTSGIEASATITGEAPNQTLNLVLPKGDKGENGKDAKESFVVTFSASGSGSDITYSCDKTYADILAAYNDGRPLVASIPVYRSGTWRGFWTNDFSYKAAAELFSPARFEFSMVYEEDDPDNLDMTAVVARLYSNDEVSIVKLPLQKKLSVSGIVKGAYNGTGGYNYSAAVAGTDYMAPATNEAQAEEGQVLTKRGDGYIWKNAPSGLPTVTTEDNGKVLRVVNGAWAAATIENANGVSF